MIWQDRVNHSHIQIQIQTYTKLKWKALHTKSMRSHNVL